MPKISELTPLTTVAGVDLLVVVDKHTAPTAPETKNVPASAAADAFLELSSGVRSDVTAVPGSGLIRNVITLTQAQYDNIATPNVNTLYLITDAS